jgi:hypothetical protein
MRKGSRTSPARPALDWGIASPGKWDED